jgi:AcrR family transcriptional regulator
MYNYLDKGQTMAKKNITADKILDAAQEEFLAKGFSGTSINDIANKADINKSLIYHHFHNKEDLWRAVKARLLSAHVEQNQPDPDALQGSFKECLSTFIKMRFDFYDHNPNIARLIAWQRLENEREDLEGIKDLRVNSILSQLKEFQQRGQIRQDMSPEMIEYLIMNMTNLPFMDRDKMFEGKDGKKNKQLYVDWLIDTLHDSLATSS